MRRSTVTLALASLALGGCRAGLPPPSRPLTTTPDAAFRAAPPETPLVPLPRVLVRTATRADGLTILSVSRPGAVTAFGWSSPHGLARPHPPGALETFVRAQAVRLRRSPGVRDVRAHAGLDGLRLRLEVPSPAAAREAASLAVIVGSAPGDRDVRYAKRSMQDSLRKEAFGSRAVTRRLLWGGLFSEGHPLALAPRGLSERVDRVSRADLVEIGVARAAAGPRTLVVVGPDAEVVAARLAAEVPVAAAAARLPGPWPLATRRGGMRIRVVRRNISPWIEMAFPVLTDDPSSPEAELAAHLLGGSLAGRLGDALRLDTGHSYALFARYQAYEGFGLIRLAGDVGEDDVSLFIERATEVVSSLREREVSSEELDAARARWRGALARDLSTAAGLADRLLESARWGEVDFEARARALAEVDPGRLRAWAQEHLRVELGQAVVFARAQALTPLSVLGDAAQVDLEPF